MTNTGTSVARLLEDAWREGVRFWSRDGQIHYRSPEPLGDDLRGRVVANKGDLIGRLTLWDSCESSWLQFQTDGVVERSGVSGTDPVIAEQAALCIAAHYAQDMTGVREACARIEDRVRKVLQQQEKGAV